MIIAMSRRSEQSVVLDKHGGLEKDCGSDKTSFGFTRWQWQAMIPGSITVTFVHFSSHNSSGANGPFNAVADQHVNNAQFTELLPKC